MTTLLETPPRAARERKNGASEAPGRQVAVVRLLTAERLEGAAGYGSWPAVARVAWAASAAWKAFLDDRELAQIRVPATVEKVTIPRTRFAAP